MSKGNSKRMMQWGVIGWGTVILGMIYGLQWGALGVARMAALTMYLVLIPCLLYAFKNTELSLRDVITACWRPVVASIVSAPVIFFSLPLLREQHLLLVVVASAIFYGLCYLVLLLTVFGMRRDIQELYSKFYKQIFKRSAATQSNL
jgi:hypothetical protein